MEIPLSSPAFGIFARLKMQKQPVSCRSLQGGEKEPFAAKEGGFNVVGLRPIPVIKRGGHSVSGPAKCF
jgi:hypothetical protein